jgi:hypothetical protein
MQRPVTKQHPSEAGAAALLSELFKIDLIQRAAERPN